MVEDPTVSPQQAQALMALLNLHDPVPHRQTGPEGCSSALLFSSRERAEEAHFAAVRRACLLAKK